MSDLPSTYTVAKLVKGTVTVSEKGFPKEILGANTVVIKPDYIGICRADIKEIACSRDIPSDRGPLFGHELVGSIVFAGSLSGFVKDDLVTFNPNITPNRTTSFAEYVFVQGSAEELDQAIVRVPETDILDNIWMPEPLACIVHATKKLLELTQLNNFKGKRIGIIGAGCSGIMFAMYAKYLGASVCVFNRGEMRRNFALEKELLTADEISSLSEVKKYRDAFDIVIVVSTIVTQTILQQAADIADSVAIIHIYGGTREGDRFLNTNVDIDTIRRSELIKEITYQSKNLKIAGAYGCYKEDYEESFKLHAEHPQFFSVEKIVSKKISFDAFPALIMNMATGSDDYPGKVVLVANQKLDRKEHSTSTI